jgi:hypothetical protein
LAAQALAEIKGGSTMAVAVTTPTIRKVRLESGSGARLSIDSIPVRLGMAKAHRKSDPPERRMFLRNSSIEL